MNPDIAAVLALLAIVAALGLLLRHGRGLASYPRVPFGVDADQDADLRRVLHDLDIHQDELAPARAA